MKSHERDGIEFRVAWRLGELREGKGLSRSDLARLTGLTERDIYRFETRSAPLGAADIAVCARAIGVKPSALFSDLAPPQETRHDAGVPRNADPAAAAALLRLFFAIPYPAVRRRLIAVVRQAGESAAIANETTR